MAAHELIGYMCQVSKHPKCGHVGGFGAVPVGQVFIVGEGEWVSGIFLCRCACHSGCPVSEDGAITEGKWKSECTCPGKEDTQAILSRRSG